LFRAFASWEENIPIDDNAKQLLISARSEYKKKFIANKVVLPDPLALPKKQWSGEGMVRGRKWRTSKWPPVYYHDISNYLEGINTPGDFLHRLNCDYKEGKSYRYFACDFVKEIFYHPVSTESNICFLKCLVTPSQRTSSKPYTVWAYCTCTAGLLGSCNHVTAMLFRVEAAIFSGITKPTCTSKLSAWNVPVPTKTLLSLKPICELTVTKSNYKKRRDKSENDGFLKLTKAAQTIAISSKHGNNVEGSSCVKILNVRTCLMIPSEVREESGKVHPLNVMLTYVPFLKTSALVVFSAAFDEIVTEK